MRAHRFNKMLGVTIQETLLAIVVGSVFVVMGLRFYKMISRDSDIRTVQSNVDTLFQSAAYYYYSQCRRQTDPVTGPITNTGLLDPTPDSSGTTQPTNPYPLSLASLQTNGYLKVNLFKSPLVSSYMVQLNETLSDRTIKSVDPTNGTTTTSNVGKVVAWRIQISALIAPQFSSQASIYRLRMAADCVSKLDASGLFVTPCSQVGAPPAAGNMYLVWERLPSMAVPNATTDYNRTLATDTKNNELYNSYSTSYLLRQPASSYPLQYYLCGS